ncbi:Alkaline phosphatase [Candidatus Rhodobacter oscarellae]|uniref:Alkaline phosphatase n=1 Tax=Candidatus Rhodobacter oscarellae TaxID=1675527 RepID=A0A0J9E9V3_9RHOB|nr:Hint domain-containing protein [Candidatus Rhodobacter lobularis]KMW59570.1 Alkaline phosphatase [Candidatus Rhodobacter lobularis]
MATINGDDNNNTLNGTGGGDDIYGGGGNDTIRGNNGFDTIYGDVPEALVGSIGVVGKPAKGAAKVGKITSGNDFIDGGANQDLIFGDGGNDTIKGGSQSDVLYGDYNPDLYGIAKIGKTLGKALPGDDLFQFDNIGDGYGDQIFGGDGFLPGTDATTGKPGKVGKFGSDNDTLDLTNTTLGGSGITATVATTTDSDGNGFDGTVTWRNEDGQVVGTLQFENIENIINNSVPCFVSGTLIDTPDGKTPIETLKVGDKVITADNGPQTIRWIGAKQLGPEALTENPNLRPIRIAAGCLGNGLPESDLVVSPQHRVLLQSNIVERVFGSKEVLVAAKKLLSLPGVSVDEEMESLTYWHILLDQHEVVLANGAQTESLYLGREGLKSMTAAARKEISLLFPEISSPSFVPRASRPFQQKAGKIDNIVARHVKNNMSLQSGSALR